MKNSFIFILIAIMHGILHCAETPKVDAEAEFNTRIEERMDRMSKTRAAKLTQVQPNLILRITQDPAPKNNSIPEDLSKLTTKALPDQTAETHLKLIPDEIRESLDQIVGNDPAIPTLDEMISDFISSVKALNFQAASDLQTAIYNKYKIFYVNLFCIANSSRFLHHTQNQFYPIVELLGNFASSEKILQDFSELPQSNLKQWIINQIRDFEEKNTWIEQALISSIQDFNNLPLTRIDDFTLNKLFLLVAYNLNPDGTKLSTSEDDQYAKAISLLKTGKINIKMTLRPWKRYLTDFYLSPIDTHNTKLKIYLLEQGADPFRKNPSTKHNSLESLIYQFLLPHQKITPDEIELFNLLMSKNVPVEEKYQDKLIKFQKRLALQEAKQQDQTTT